MPAKIFFNDPKLGKKVYFSSIFSQIARRNFAGEFTVFFAKNLKQKLDF
jgi:hypothetical protein